MPTQLKPMLPARTPGLVPQFRAVVWWLVCLLVLAALAGSACALFLWSLEEVTAARFARPWLLYFLPLAGLLVGLVYHHWGKPAEGGNNLILEQIHEPGGGVPRRMAPLILCATLVTHLFGGSAGREGTAVQMGGSIASGLGRLFRLDRLQTRLFLMAGIAAGFGAVFGTPLAGAVFALEVLMLGRMQYAALVPCLLAALASDAVCQMWGGTHTQYHVAAFAGALPGWSSSGLLIWAKVAVLGIACGLASSVFAKLTHGISGIFKSTIAYAPLRPLFGGLLVIALVHAAGTRDYLGLGVWSPHPGDVTILSLFAADQVHYWSWAWKILFTAVTLGCGFKGGEVTPLFFIGAALGNALSGVMHGPMDLFAALGFVAIFAGASNTPLACTIMGIELFGAAHAVSIATACFLAYLCSGRSGIYLSQRLAVPKASAHADLHGLALREVRELPIPPWRVLRVKWRALAHRSFFATAFKKMSGSIRKRCHRQ